MKSKTDIPPQEINERLLAGDMSRRQFHKVLAAAGIAMVATPVVSRRALAAPADQATYFTWGGYDIPELFAPYIETHGEAPNFAAFGGSEEGLTKLMGGYVVDVAHPCNAVLPRWVASGLLQPFDLARLSNWDDVIPALKNLEGSVHNGGSYFAPMDWGQTSITYREDLFDLQGAEESWDMLWDERYAGRIGVIASAGDTWWCATIFAGVDFTDMTTDENFQKVASLLRQQRPLIRLYTDDMTTLEQALASGELVAAMTWNETPVSLKKEGLPVKFANPKEGALTWVCGAMMHKDAPNPERAHDIINSLISVETGRYIIDEFGYGHSNAKAFDEVGDERLAELGLSRNPSELLDAGKFQVPLPEEFTSKMNAEFEQIKAGF
jgi:spermidine/putrescine transport system substrate-binding protein